MVRDAWWLQAGDQLVRGVTCSGVSGVIVHQCGQGKHGGPISLVGRHQVEELFDPLVLSLRKSVSLQVVSHGELPGYPQFFSQYFPKVRSKVRVSICD